MSASTGSKNYDKKDNLNDQFPKCHIKILLGSFKGGGPKKLSKPIIGNENLQEICEDNVDRTVNFTSKHLMVKITMFPHRKVHKYILNVIILMERHAPADHV